MLLGLCTGLPTVLIEKWLLRNKNEFYAEFFVTSLLGRLRWRMEKRNLLCCLPIYAYLAAWAIIVSVFHEPDSSGLLVGVVLSVILYTEQKAIYEASKARVIAAGQNDQ